MAKLTSSMGAHTKQRVFFEPWALGDAVIAAAVLRETAGADVLASHSRWHPLLSSLWEGGPPRLLPVDLPYTTRSARTRFDAGAESLEFTGFDEVLSIRGDLRDWRVAQRVFPGARRNFRGWVPFIARRSALIDFPYRAGWGSVWNRYRAWCTLAGVPYADLESAYARRRQAMPVNGPVMVHVGAQWRSKQYPEVVALVTALRAQGLAPQLVMGPGDFVPVGIAEADVRVPDLAELVAGFRSASWVITNDSGPMHWAAAIGARVLALARTSNLQEWLPPGVHALCSPFMPRGYRADPEYQSDKVLSGWPTVAEVLAVISAAEG